MRFVVFSFGLLYSKPASLEYCLTQFNPSKIWKQYAVLLGIRAESSNMKVSECLGVNLNPVQKIRKKVDETSGDSDCTAAWKPHSDRSDKRTPNLFVKFIQAMTDSNPN